MPMRSRFRAKPFVLIICVLLFWTLLQFQLVIQTERKAAETGRGRTELHHIRQHELDVAGTGKHQNQTVVYKSSNQTFIRLVHSGLEQTLSPVSSQEQESTEEIASSFVLDKGLKAYTHFITSEQRPARDNVTTVAIHNSATTLKVRSHLDKANLALGLSGGETPGLPCLPWCSSLQEQESTEEIASSFVLDKGLKAYTHFITSEQRPARDDVTLTTHTTLSGTNIERVRLTATGWGGPVSCAVWLTSDPSSDIERLRRLVQQNATDFAKTSFHIVWTTKSYSGPRVHTTHLMRVAEAGAHTHFILNTDRPLLPSPGMYVRVVLLITASKWRSALHLGSNAILIPVQRPRHPSASVRSLASSMESDSFAGGPKAGELSKAQVASTLQPRGGLEGAFPGREEDVAAFSKWRNDTDLYLSHPGSMDAVVLVSRRGGLLQYVQVDSLHRKKCLLSAAECWRRNLAAAGYTFYTDSQSFFVDTGGVSEEFNHANWGDDFDGMDEGSRSENFGQMNVDGSSMQPLECGEHEFATADAVASGSIGIGQIGGEKSGSELAAFSNFAAAKQRAQAGDITLVTQCDFDSTRMRRMVELVRMWGGPASVAILIKGDDRERELADLAAGIVEFRKDLLQTSIHIVFIRQLSHGGEEDHHHHRLWRKHKKYTMDDGRRLLASHYDDRVREGLQVRTRTQHPINRLRNVALQAVETDFAFYVDVDLLPSPGLREELQKWVLDAEVGELLRRRKGALVVPAFEQSGKEYMGYRDAVQKLPSNKRELHELVKAQKIQMFHFDNPGSHDRTDYRRWFGEGWDTPYSIRLRASVGYEPYVLLGAGIHGLLPRFWDGFDGFGWNRQTWVAELVVAGYTFMVLPHGFITHVWHDKKDKRQFTIYKEFEKFARYLAERYLVPERKAELRWSMDGNHTVKVRARRDENANSMGAPDRAHTSLVIQHQGGLERSTVSGNTDTQTVAECSNELRIRMSGSDKSFQGKGEDDRDGNWWGTERGFGLEEEGGEGGGRARFRGSGHLAGERMGRENVRGFRGFGRRGGDRLEDEEGEEDGRARFRGSGHLAGERMGRENVRGFRGFGRRGGDRLEDEEGEEDGTEASGVVWGIGRRSSVPHIS